MEYYQIGVNAFIQNEKVLYVWLHEFQNHRKINDNWEIKDVKLFFHVKRLEFEIAHRKGKVIAFVFINFFVHNKRKTNLLDVLQEELGKIETSL